MAKQTSKSNTVLAFILDEASEEAIKSIPFKDMEMTLLLMRGSAKTAYDYLKDHPSPNLLLVDISDAKLPISDVSALAEVCEPGVEVIAIGNNNDIAIFRGLLNLGVKDYIVKPLSANLLRRSLEGPFTEAEKLENLQGFSRLGSVISFIGAHGGVGTSTLVSNCGWLLSEQYFKQVYLVDLHLQTGTLCHFFNLKSTPGLINILTQPERIDKNLIDKSFEKFSDRLIIACSQESLSQRHKIELESLRKLFTLLKSQSHFTIVDLPRNFESPITQSILNESNFVVIVTDLTLLSVRDTSRLLDILKEGEMKDQKVIIAANRVGEYKQGEIDRAVFEKSINRTIDYLIRFDPITPLEALNAGTPAAMGKHVLAQDIQKFVNVFIGKELSTEGGFFSKILHPFHSKRTDN